MKKVLVLSLVAIFVSFASVSAQTAPAKEKAKTEKKACCKEGDKKECAKDAKACEKKAEGKACCKEGAKKEASTKK